MIGDIKQLTRRPEQPDGQQLLQGASGVRGAAVQGEDGGLWGSSMKGVEPF